MKDEEFNFNLLHNAEAFGIDKSDLPDDVYPLTYKLIAKEQQKDSSLMRKLHRDSYKFQTFHAAGKKIDLIVNKDKIVIPKSLQHRTVEWYHQQLCHPGINRTEESIRQHFTWTNLHDDVEKVCKKCDTCQRTKRSYTKYGKLPPKEAEAEPWDRLCVDLIGPYTITRKRKKKLTLWCVTMIDPATGWFEIRQIPNKSAITIANLVEQTWFTRYPWPTIINFDRGSEFMGEFAKMVKNNYGIKTKAITSRNPQANAIIERVHQTLGNIIRTFEAHSADIDEDDPWSGILSAASFAIRATYHTTLRATPTQLVFGRDAMLNIQHKADWNYIKNRKQMLIDKNNEQENSKRMEYKYKINDEILIKQDWNAKYSTNPYKGPFKITEVFNNGTIRYQKGATTDIINIRNIQPYIG